MVPKLPMYHLSQRKLPRTSTRPHCCACASAKQPRMNEAHVTKGPHMFHSTQRNLSDSLCYCLILFRLYAPWATRLCNDAWLYSCGAVREGKGGVPPDCVTEIKLPLFQAQRLPSSWKQRVSPCKVVQE